MSRFKEGWHKIPEVMFSGFVAVLGVCMTGVVVLSYRKSGAEVAGMNKLSYTVIRDTDIKDDPRLPKYN